MKADKHYQIVEFLTEEFNKLKIQGNDKKVTSNYQKKKRLIEKMTSLLLKIDDILLKVDSLHNQTREELRNLHYTIKAYLDSVF